MDCSPPAGQQKEALKKLFAALFESLASYNIHQNTPPHLLIQSIVLVPCMSHWGMFRGFITCMKWPLTFLLQLKDPYVI